MHIVTSTQLNLCVLYTPLLLILYIPYLIIWYARTPSLKDWDYYEMCPTHTHTQLKKSCIK